MNAYKILVRKLSFKPEMGLKNYVIHSINNAFDGSLLQNHWAGSSCLYQNL